MIIPDNFKNFTKIKAAFYNAAESVEQKDVVLMHQTHSSMAQTVTNMPSELVNADALVTRTAGLKLAVKTADCIPLLLADEENTVIAAVHVGWRSGLKGIIETALLKMIGKGAELSKIKAALGPSLQPASFQVKTDMVSLYPPMEQQFFEKTADGFLFNATDYVVYRLKRVGVTDIFVSAVDTFTDKSYNSYRRQPDNPARQYGVIEIIKQDF